MNIGFYTKWPLNSLTSQGFTYGDELYANSLIKYINRNRNINSALYSTNSVLPGNLDFLIHINDTKPKKGVGKNILYLQNPYQTGSYSKLQKLRKHKYDGYIFISRSLLNKHKKDGFKGVYLPFGIDTEVFYPQKESRKYSHDICYMGSNYKNIRRTIKYLLPATNFNLGLYGAGWGENDYFNSDIFKNLISAIRKYKRIVSLNLSIEEFVLWKLHRFWKGKLSQNEARLLYNSSRICLNYSDADNVEWDVTTLRSIEILACKGFLLTDYISSIDKNFNSGAVIIRSGDNITQLIDYYLHHNKERDKIAQKGYSYVMLNSRIDERADQLLKYVTKL